MVTTFARLAKVLKGYIKPANWIERAFASVASALVPSYTLEDENKVLGVTKVEDGYDETVVIEKQTITLNSSKRAGLAQYTHHFSDIKDGDHVYVTIVHGTTVTNIDCVYVYANLKIEGEGITIGYQTDPTTRPLVTYTAGTASESYEISAVTRETKYKAESAWVEGGSGTLVVNQDIMTGVLDKTWKEIADAITGGAVLATKVNGGVTIAPIYASVVAPIGEQKYEIHAHDYESYSDLTFTAATENDYPTAVEGGD